MSTPPPTDANALAAAELALHQARINAGLSLLNLVCFIAGMIGLWAVTRNPWALVFGWVASLHFTYTLKLKSAEVNPNG